MMNKKLEVPPSEDLSLEKIHWSKVHSPNFKGFDLTILSKPTPVTKKCYLAGESCKLDESQSRIVEFDCDYLTYQMIDVVAPLIVEVINTATPVTHALETLFERITEAIAIALNDCADCAIETCNAAEQADIDFPLNRETLLKAYLRSIQKNHC